MDRPSTSETENAEAPPAIEVSEQAANADSSQEDAADEECVTGMELDVYEAATTGDITVLWENRQRLSEKLTATLNTVLHVYVACSSSLDKSSAKVVATVDSILAICPALLCLANKRGETALHIAARHGHDDIVQHLIDAAKADLEEGCLSLLLKATNKDGDTALHEAVRFNHVDVVKILTEEDPMFSYSTNAAGESPLYMAVERGRLDLVTKILVTCNDVAFQGPNGRTALHAAVSYNDIEMTKILLSYYTDERALTKKVDEEGMTPLHLAALFGHTSIVEELLKYDKSAAYVRDKDDGRTALHIAVSKGHICVFEELIAQCPDCCELLDKRDRSILHYAIEKSQLRIQDFIRNNRWLSNVLLNGKDADLKTPLQESVAAFVRERGKLLGKWMSPWKSSNGFIRDARVDKMAFNKRNQNAFDIIRTDIVLLEKDLRRNLKANGGRPGHRLVIQQDQGEQETEIKRASKEASDARMQELRQAHLIVATLIATVTFTAGITLPVGYKSPKKGPIKDYVFVSFLLANTISMVFSASSVALHFALIAGGRPEMFELLMMLTSYALFFMLCAFYTGLWTILRDNSDMTILVLLPVCLVVCLFFFFTRL